MSDQIIYFRNRVQVLGIDPDCLWKLSGNKLVLVDDDQYIAVPFEDYAELFYQIEQ
jgi:hypothetical protein